MFVSVGSASTVCGSACDAYEIARLPTVMVKTVQTSAVSLPLSKVVVATQYMPRKLALVLPLDQTFLVPLIFWNFGPREISEVHFW